MEVKTKTYNGRTYEEGTLTLFPNDKNKDIGSSKLELGNKIYWVTVVACGGETRNGKPKWGFMTLREAGKDGPKKKW